MKYLDLFTGIGGFTLGIGDKAECIGFSEIDKYAAKVYQHHFPTHKNYGDITKINADELPDFDLLVGGFPCQSFSIAGKRGGFEDTRGTLFFDIARILRAKQPRLFLLENVKGLLSHDSGKTFHTIIKTLDELGYDLQWQVLNSKNHGVPQNRERIFIIGNLRGTSRPEVFPFGESSSRDIQSQGAPQSEGQRIRSDYSSTVNTRFGSTARGQQLIAKTLAVRDYKGGNNLLNKEMKIRRLTPTECERLQGFPDGWTAVENTSDSQRYKMCGNAVTVNVIRDIMEKLI